MLHFRRGRLLCAAALLATISAPVAAQGGSGVDLGKRLARSRYTLGRVVGLHELPDGRVVVADAKEGVFRLVDLTRGDVGLIGKQGDGPEEYRSAAAVLSLPGDSLLLYDALGRKLLHLSPNGAITTVAPFTTTSTRARRNGSPVASDATGALYYTSFEIDTAAKTMELPVTTAVRRRAPGASSDDEILRINTRRPDQAKAPGLLVFPFRDAWAVRTDGLVARVLADTYQVIWSRNGKETGRTGPLPYQPIPITSAEQRTITDSVRQGMKAMISGAGSAGMAGPQTRVIGDGGSVSVGDGGGGGGGAPMVMIFRGGGGEVGAGDRIAVEAGHAAGQAATNGVTGKSFTFDPSMIPIAPFPATRPAIMSNGNAAMFDGNGMLWVARERPHGDAIPRYDIVAEDRGIVGTVKLPAGTRLLGFGRGVVYLGRAEEGSDWLERYPMPKMR